MQVSICYINSSRNSSPINSSSAVTILRDQTTHSIEATVVLYAQGN
jgi:hypothetical protein